MDNYFQILGVATDADLLTIKKAYRQLAKQFHPDHNPDPDAQAHFIRITEAYEQLIGKSKNTNDFFSFQAAKVYDDEIRERAKEYARIRYEQFIRRSTAYDRLSIHKVLWGKEISVLLLLLSLVLVVDNLMPGVTETIPVSHLQIVRANKSHSINLKVTSSHFSFYANDEHTPDDFGNTTILVKHSPLFYFVEAYWLPKDQFKIRYEPDQKVSDYILFPYVVFILSLLTLTYRFKTFENKLMIKMVTIIAIVCFLTIYFVFK